MNPKTGEIFVVGPLDREKRSLHFIIVNVTEIDNNSDALRPTRQTNPVIERTFSFLFTSFGIQGLKNVKPSKFSYPKLEAQNKVESP